MSHYVHIWRRQHGLKGTIHLSTLELKVRNGNFQVHDSIKPPAWYPASQPKISESSQQDGVSGPRWRFSSPLQSHRILTTLATHRGPNLPVWLNHYFWLGWDFITVTITSFVRSFLMHLRNTWMKKRELTWYLIKPGRGLPGDFNCIGYASRQICSVLLFSNVLHQAWNVMVQNCPMN